ncbi:MAG: PAS domain-containing protein [Alphaproteobacteria bacterium]
MSSNRRITELLPSFWYNLKKDDGLPFEDEIEPKDIEELLSDSFLIKANLGTEKKNYSFIGENLALSYIDNKKIRDPLEKQLNAKIVEAINLKEPIATEGEFITEDNLLIKYRQALLPFKSKDSKTNYVLGAIRWKIY